MKIKQRDNKSAQATLAYIIFIMVVIAAFSAMIWTLRHKLQASYKESADAFGEGRQFGSFSTSGGVAPFVFPVLPGGNPVIVAPPVPGGINCDSVYLDSLSKEALKKLEIATTLQQEANNARLAEVEAQLAAVIAQEAARVAREEAAQARKEADDARQAANAKQAECDTCNASYYEDYYYDCTPICDEAVELAEVATEKKGIATEKKGIATEKERIAAEKQAAADELDKIAIEKEQVAAQATEEAVAAAEALRQANEACYDL